MPRAPQRANRDSPAARPFDAAGLVLLRDASNGPEVLLGRRHGRAGFLPDIYVFPGGGVDAADGEASGFPEPLHRRIARDLEIGQSGRPPWAFARAALRETFEETGLLIAGADGTGIPIQPGAAAVWQAYASRGLRPAFDRLDYVCRAITPTYSRRRYNTRFFLADGDMADGTLTGDGELEDLGWRGMAALRHLAIVDVTQFVLREALRRWRLRSPVGTQRYRLFCYRGQSSRWRIADRGPWRLPPAAPVT